MSEPRLRPLQDRGAVLVHVGIALLVLAAFSAVVLDYGILWISRGQAQNAADAGALAGAISLAWDSDDRSSGGVPATRATAAANENRVWGQPAGVTPTVPDPISFPTCPDGTNTCIRVNVYRNEAHNNALPVFFARLFGRSEQGVQAMAIGQAAYGNAAKCLKPWAIPDKWEEHYPIDPGTWDWNQEFDLFDKHGNPVTPPDRYDGFEGAPLGTNSSYTGYKASPPWPSAQNDIGMQVRFKMGSPNQAATPGWFQPIDLPLPGGPETGGDRYRENIANCNPGLYNINDPTPLVVEPGNMIGPTAQGVAALIASDPGTVWNPALNGGRGGADCNTSLGACTGNRVVSIPVYDPYVYEMNRHSGRVVLQIRKVMGFYVDRMDGNDVLGYFVGAPGEIDPAQPSGGPTSWLRVIRLVR
jgi:Putative Flp pilus-assembly TadE/G-like